MTNNLKALATLALVTAVSAGYAQSTAGSPTRNTRSITGKPCRTNRPSSPKSMNCGRKWIHNGARSTP